MDDNLALLIIDSCHRSVKSHSRRPVSKGKTDADLSFEQAMQKLESIVDQMENGDMPLDKLIASYEEGSQFLKVCSARLEDAEKKIEILKKKGENPEFGDFDPDSK